MFLFFRSFCLPARISITKYLGLGLLSVVCIIEDVRREVKPYKEIYWSSWLDRLDYIESSYIERAIIVVCCSALFLRLYSSSLICCTWCCLVLTSRSTHLCYSYALPCHAIPCQLTNKLGCHSAAYVRFVTLIKIIKS